MKNKFNLPFLILFWNKSAKSITWVYWGHERHFPLDSFTSQVSQDISQIGKEKS
jgi:hypothetical protein